MKDELLRAVVGLPIAVLWPLGVPGLARSGALRAAAAALVAALVLAQVLPEAEGWLLVAFAGVLAWRLRPPASVAPPGTAIRPLPLLLALGAALVACLAAAVALDPSAAWETVRDGARADDVVFVVLGVLAALPVAGAIVSWSLSPLAARLAADPRLQEQQGMLRAGLYIGWCERALVFAFLAGGEPGAAGLALTAKSVARFPAFNSGSEALAEYVLIGTLWSFLLATAVAMGVRALLGLPVL